VSRYSLLSDVASDADIEAAFEWYESEQPGLGFEFLGEELEFDPDSALSMIEDIPHFQGWFKRLIVVSELRLAVYLQTGELISMRAPSKMRSLLSLRHDFSWFSRFIVRAHAFVWP
jgi:hypothetical protein